MDQSTREDPIRSRFRTALTDFYGARLERAVLFGSRARGDHQPDSDYDVAVFLHHTGDLWDELGPLAHMSTAILIDTGAIVSAKPFRAGSYAESSYFMEEIARDGIEL